VTIRPLLPRCGKPVTGKEWLPVDPAHRLFCNRSHAVTSALSGEVLRRNSPPQTATTGKDVIISISRGPTSNLAGTSRNDVAPRGTRIEVQSSVKGPIGIRGAAHSLPSYKPEEIVAKLRQDLQVPETDMTLHSV
jgi:hypothetical protein